MARLRFLVATVVVVASMGPGLAKAEPVSAPNATASTSENIPSFGNPFQPTVISPSGIPFPRTSSAIEASSESTSASVATRPARAEVAAAKRLIVRFSPSSSASDRASLRNQAGVRSSKPLSLLPGLEIWEMKLAANRPAGSVAAIQNSRLLRNVEVDQVRKVAKLPNDPSYASQWALPAIKAPAAWDRDTGSKKVIVAILDTGINRAHPDLKDNLWVNEGEIPGNNIDDDNNGYVDDRNGWDFVGHSPDNSDVFGHGTHVAGIIGATGNNLLGVSGINWNVSLMSLKVCNDYGGCDLSAMLWALDYAVSNGARISNNSYGGEYTPSSIERDAIIAAGAKGHLFIAAAGNNMSNNDNALFLPASYDAPNIISVAATNPSGSLAYFSNFGVNTVDIAAPGQDIYSTAVDGTYVSMSGTSMASPYVAGVAALVASSWATTEPGTVWTVPEMKARLLSTSTPLTTLANKVFSGGLVNAQAAVDISQPLLPLISLAINGSGFGRVTIDGVSCADTSCVVRSTRPLGSDILLEAAPTESSIFSGWGGACTGSTNSCSISLEAVQSVTATFYGENLGPLQVNLMAGDPAVSGGGWWGIVRTVLSPDGQLRATTRFTYGNCYYLGSYTGGITIEKLVDGKWVKDGDEIQAPPPLIPDVPSSRWFNCSFFGYNVDFSDDGKTMVVNLGAGFDAYSPTPRLCGAAVYERSDSGWQIATILKPSDFNLCWVESLTWIGAYESNWRLSRISADGKRIVVSGVNQAWVFDRGVSNWRLAQTINLSSRGNVYDLFFPVTLALAADGKTFAVGLPGTNLLSQGYYKGKVQVFKRDSSSFSQSALLQPTDDSSTGTQGLGLSVALDEDGSTLVASYGRTWITLNNLTNWTGGAWIYEFRANRWDRVRNFDNPKPESINWSPDIIFTCPSISRDGRRLLCGSPGSWGNNSHMGWFVGKELEGFSWSGNLASQYGFLPEGKAFDYSSLSSSNSDLSLSYGAFSWNTYVSRQHGDDALGLEISFGALFASVDVPVVGLVTSTNKGFTFSVTNYDAALTYSAVTSVGSISMGTPTSGSLPFSVTGLNDNQLATVVLTVSRPGFSSTRVQVEGSSLPPAAPTAIFSTPQATTNGFTVSIRNYDPLFTYTLSSSAGNVSRGSVTGSTLPLSVVGLDPGQTSTITVQVSRIAYATVTSQVTGSSVPKVVEPALAKTSALVGGYSSAITNFLPANRYVVTTSAGRVRVGSAVGGQLPFTVLGLAPGQSSVVTVTASRRGFVSSVTTLSGTSLESIPVNEVSNVKSGVGSCTLDIANFSPDLVYSAVSSVGRVSLVRPSTGTMTTRVLGLSPNQEATIRLTSSLPSSTYSPATSDLKCSALADIPLPVVSSTTGIRGGFTATLLNFDPNLSYTFTTTVGRVSRGRATGSTLAVSVTGLSPGQSAVVTVTANFPGSAYSPQTIQVVGSAL